MNDNSDQPDEEIDLFRSEMSKVREISQDKVPPYRQAKPPRPVKKEQDEQQVIKDMLSDPIDPAELETGDELSFARTGLQHNVLRKLRRGQFSIEAELDLHRMTSEQARQAVAVFLPQMSRSGKRCIRIIHGKGHGSINKMPVLKNKLNHWLRQRDEVLAFCSARPVDGGTGAVYVLLKRTDK